jgi:hypothetical protein
MVLAAIDVLSNLATAITATKALQPLNTRGVALLRLYISTAKF